MIGIHQPNFAPWSGFWVKYLRSERFVILDSAQMTWGGVINRAKMDFKGPNKWLTVATIRKSNLKINEVVIANKDYKNELLHKIKGTYGREEYFDLIDQIIPVNEEFLFNLNMKIMHKIIQILCLPKKEIIFLSDLNVSGHKNELLVNILKEIGEANYLSGDGARVYHDESVFKKNKIQVNFLNYEQNEELNGHHKVIPGLSILDAILKLGPIKTREYLMQQIVKF